jgi:hypothetical protein
MRPLLTARQLSALATTAEEQELSRQAERLADHAIDRAFVVAMRDAAENARSKPRSCAPRRGRRPRRRPWSTRRRSASANWRRSSPQSPELGREVLQDQLEVARAELELDRDELATATDALQRAGGDPQVRIRLLREVYDAAQKEPRPPVAAPPATGPASSLVERLRAWVWHRGVQIQLSEARRDIAERAQRLAARRADLTARLENITRARERHETRRRLNQAIVELPRGKRAA